MKPQEMFVGARDFFAVLVPGAIFLILLPVTVTDWLRQNLMVGSTSYAGMELLAFAVASYAVGTLISGVAGQFDKSVDRRIRDRLAGTSQLTNLEENLARAELLAKCLEESINKHMRGFSRETRPWSTRSFWWNYIRLNCPEGISELDRIEGHQKLFRSLALVSLALALIHALLRWVEKPMPINPTLLAIGAFFAFFGLYVRYRMIFARRLYELAIVLSIPAGNVDTGSKAFFDDGDAWKALLNRQLTN